MARTALDTTNVYRFRVEHNATYVSYEEYRDHGGRGHGGVYSGGVEPGTPYRDVKIVGPYTRKVAWNGWVPNYGTLKVERQQLMIGAELNEDGLPVPALYWGTIETKRYEDGEPVL